MKSEKLLKRLLGIVKEQEKSQKEDRLYVIIRDDLSKSQKTVQGIHAASEFILWEKRGNWINGTVVCLKVKNEKELKDKENWLKSKKIPYRSFIEPDIGHETTALALIGKKGLFSELSLL